jgi:hypothetical protein
MTGSTGETAAVTEKVLGGRVRGGVLVSGGAEGLTFDTLRA